LIINYKNDIDQISIVLREGVNDMSECASLAKPSLYFNSNGGFVLLNVFGVESASVPLAHDDHDHDDPARVPVPVPAAPTISSATKLSSIFINAVGVVAFFVLFQKHHRMSLLVLAVVILLLPYSL
jgi:hypothetical protein